MVKIAAIAAKERGWLSQEWCLGSSNCCCRLEQGKSGLEVEATCNKGLVRAINKLRAGGTLR